MENKNKGQGQEQEPQKPKINIFRSIILILLSVIMVFGIFWLLSNNQKGENITDTEYVQWLEEDKIVRVEFNAKYVNIKCVDGKWYYLINNSDAIDAERYNLVISQNEKIKAENVILVGQGQQPKVLIEIYTGSTTTFNIMNLIYPVLIVVSIGLLIFITVRQLKGINKNSMDFTKNRARISESTVKFDKVAGSEEEKRELEEIIQFLKNPDKFTKIGARIPKGVLLVGPPGTGKTLLARAVAGEAEVPFFTISGSDFMELYVGVGASRVRDLFENAKKAKPCIVFIDEIDAVGRQRGTGLGGGNDEREQTLNQLLVQMDGFEPNEGVIIMAATNRADILDPALTRPGRFDRQIYISAPDVNEREAILKVHAKGKPLAKDVELKNIARVTTGFTGADLENLLNEAAILAARKDQEKISMEDINNAMVKVAIGPQKRSKVVSEKDRKITAYHEAGHAIVEKSVKNGDPVHEVSIIQRGGAAGYTISRPENDENFMSKQKLYDTIAVMLGGRCAEEIFLDDITTGASSDLTKATNIARKMVAEWGMSDSIGLVHYGEGDSLFLGRDYQNRAIYSEKQAALIDDEIKKVIDGCYKETIEILKKNKKYIETMVDVLLEKETIYADEVNMIMEGASSEEVIKSIDEKLKAKEESLKKVKEENYVDMLLKEAEKRAEEKEKNEELNKDVEIEKTTEENKEDKNEAQNNSNQDQSKDKKDDDEGNK